MVFWILIFALTLAAMIYVCMPLLRSEAATSNDMQTEKMLYEARLVELDNEFSLGRIDETSLNAAKAEEARKLLKLSNAISPSATPLFSSKFPLLATALFTPIFSLVLYLSLGTPEAAFEQETVTVSNEANLEELLVVAERRLEEEPDDLRGWIVVAPVYARQGNFQKAINAYENAIRLSDKDDDLTFALGEVLVNQSEGIVTDDALALFQKTLELNKEHGSARFMLGMAAFQSGKNDDAIRIWQALIDSARGDEDWINVVQQRVDQLRAENSKKKGPQLSQEALDNAASLSNEERSELVNQMVANLAKRLEDDPSDKQSWARLIRSYIVLGRYDDAEVAINKAAGLFPDDTNFKQFASDLRAQIKDANTGSNQ